jgi:hypothetical protein
MHVKLFQSNYSLFLSLLNAATNSMANATYFQNQFRRSFTLPHGLQLGRTAFTYHSERFNARATHIRHCPREPREVHRTSGSWFPPANRVRNATASGSVNISK